MGTKFENTMRIRELEEELSDERIAELFRLDDEDFRSAAIQSRAKRRSAFRGLIAIAGVAVFVFVFFQLFVPTIVNERSMEDTIEQRDCVLLSVRAYDSSEPELGDLIMFESRVVDENGVPRDFIRRVIGVPGDMIEIKSGNVYRNGEILDEPYTKDGITNGDMAAEIVPEGFFVLGDNRQISIDSRDARVGFVKTEDVIGKVAFRILPVSKAGAL